MKKKLLIMLAMMMAMVSQAAITPTDNQLWWGYFNETDASSLDYSGNLGYSKQATIDAAFFIPANHGIVSGTKINAIRFWLGDDLSSISSDLTLWISKSLPLDISSSDYTQIVSKSSLAGRLNEIILSTPYNVGNAGIYVGFSFSISARSFPVMSGGNNVENGFFYRTSGNNWDDFYEYSYGNLAMQVLLDDVSLSNNSATPSDFVTTYVEKDGSVSVPVKVTNYGKESIASISYTITTNGSTSAEQSLQMNNVEFNTTEVVYIPFTSDAEAKKYSKTLTITKVNGAANQARTKSSTGNLITIKDKPEVVPVVEEFTATWCGYCPYGMVGMEKTHEAYGDKVALIAIHKDDVMETRDYSSITTKNYPSSRINREKVVYPTSSSLEYYIERAFNRVTVGNILAEARWTGNDQSVISIDTKTKFVYTDDNGQYGIAYVLVEDGLSGSGYDWLQSNYLSGGSGDSEMQFWYDAGSSVSGLEFNHVAVAAWSVKDGVDGSVNSKIVEGDTQNYSFKANIANNTLIQDKSKLKVIALLIDRSTGAIVNATQTTIAPASETMDLNTLIQLIMKGEYDEKADLHKDGKVEATDLVLLINMLK